MTRWSHDTYLTQLSRQRGSSDWMVLETDSTFLVQVAPCNDNPTNTRLMYYKLKNH